MFLGDQIFLGWSIFFSGQRGGANIFLGSRRGGLPFPREGTTIFSQCQRGNFFSRRQKGGPEFFYVCQGGDQKKLVTGHHKETAPLPVKNDSSLKIFSLSPCPLLSTHTYTGST